MRYLICLFLALLPVSAHAAVQVFFSRASFFTAVENQTQHSLDLEVFRVKIDGCDNCDFFIDLVPLSNPFTLSQTTISANSVTGYNDSYGRYIGTRGNPTFSTTKTAIAFDLGSFFIGQTISYNVGGATGNLVVPGYPLAFIGFVSDDGPISGTFSNNSELDFFTIYEADRLVHAAVPEPAEWLLLVIGFGFLGSVMRRREKMDTRYPTPTLSEPAQPHRKQRHTMLKGLAFLLLASAGPANGATLIINQSFQTSQPDGYAPADVTLVGDFFEQVGNGNRTFYIQGVAATINFINGSQIARITIGNLGPNLNFYQFQYFGGFYDAFGTNNKAVMARLEANGERVRYGSTIAPIVTLDGRRLTIASDVPEPNSWAFFIAGLGVIGWAMRRQIVGQHRSFTFTPAAPAQPR